MKLFIVSSWSATPKNQLRCSILEPYQLLISNRNNTNFFVTSREDIMVTIRSLFRRQDQEHVVRKVRVAFCWNTNQLRKTMTQLHCAK